MASSSFFLGRTQEQDQFRRVLEQYAPTSLAQKYLPTFSKLLGQAPKLPDEPYIFLFHGPGGMGKTTLIRRLKVLVDYEFQGQYQTVLIDWGRQRDLNVALQREHSRIEPQTVLDNLHKEFKNSLKPYTGESYRKARQAVLKIESEIEKALISEPPNTELKEVAAQYGGKAIAWILQKATEGTISADSNGIAVAIEVGSTLLSQARQLVTKSLSQEEVDILQQPLETLLKGLGKDIAKATQRQPAVIFLDTYDIVDRMACDYALRQVIQKGGARAIWVISGRSNLAKSSRRGKTYFRGYSDDFSEAQIYPRELLQFSIREIQEHFEQKLPDSSLTESEAEAIAEFSLGIPFVVDMAATMCARGKSIAEIVAPMPIEGGEVSTRDQLIRVICERFLMYCLDTPETLPDRQLIFALAMLRRSQMDLLGAMVDMSEGLRERLSILQEKYSLLADDKRRLDEKMSNFMQDYLLQDLQRKDILVQRLNDNAVAWLELQIEVKQKTLSNIEEIFQDKQLADWMLDLTHHYGWRGEDALWEYLVPRFIEAWQYEQTWGRNLLQVAETFRRLMGNSHRNTLEHMAIALGTEPDSTEISSLLGYLEQWLERQQLDLPREQELQAILKLCNADLHITKEQYDEALDISLSIVSHCPVALHSTLAGVLRQIAWKFVLVKRVAIPSEQGLIAAKQSTELNAEDEANWIVLGVAQYGLKRYDEAIASYYKAIELVPNNAVPHNHLGDVYVALERYDEAIASYYKAIELDPSFATSHNSLGSVYCDQKLYDEAIVAHEKAIELDPSFAAPHNGLGNVYSNLRRYDEAIATYKKAIELDPSDALYCCNLGIVYFDLKQYEHAIACYEKAIELSPDYAFPYDGLGNVYLAIKQYKEAIENYLKALELNPKNPDFHNNLGDAYKAKGEQELSVISYQRAFELYPKELFSITLSDSPVSTLAGEELELCIHLSRVEQVITTNDQTYFLEVPSHEALGSELNLLLVAPGFQHKNTEATSVPIDLRENTQLTTQTINFNLCALYVGTFRIIVELHLNNDFKSQLETTIEVIESQESFIPRKQKIAYSRPLQQPDFLLQIQTYSSNYQSGKQFHYQLDGYHPRWLFVEEYTYQSVSSDFNLIQLAITLLEKILKRGHQSSYQDNCFDMVSLGQYLFNHLFPLELQRLFYQIGTGSSILMLVSQDISIPWELLHDGKQFLGERFLISRWPWELDKACPHEFPIGSVTVGHYHNVERPENWIELLEVAGGRPPLPLLGGTLTELSLTDTLQGLHWLRMGESPENSARQDAPVLLESKSETQTLNQEIRPAKLSLRRNRPLASLGYLNTNQSEWTNLTSTWASTFIRAGCSAFVGPLWAVQPQVEAAFVSTFYSRLWEGNPLGESFRAARQMARVAVPDSMDWLAYVLFGDPMARPYRPVEGQGYAIVEPVGQDIDQPVMPGARVRFRASLRRKPPIWYENRLMDVAEKLEFDQLKIYVVTSELQVEPGECIDMTKTPGGDYLGWFTLTMPVELTGRSALVQVHFEDGMEPIHSLRFAVQVADADGGAA